MKTHLQATHLFGTDLYPYPWTACGRHYDPDNWIGSTLVITLNPSAVTCSRCLASADWKRR